MARTKSKRESGTCCLGCLGLPFSLLALIVLFLTLHAALVFAWGRDVPGRAERLSFDRKNNYELRYSYTVGGKRYEGVTRLSAQEGSRVRPSMSLKVRAFEPLPAYGAFVIGWGPPAGATLLALGALCIPLLLVGSLPLLALCKGRTPPPTSAQNTPSATSLPPPNPPES